ncbi:MAG TPA: phage major capsid protein [Pyrinomonadaceae bacterium]|nr:phage major capsid protein [Pyrinomonadaceae bacterium]
MAYNDLITRDDASALIPEEVSKEIFQDLPKQSVALSMFPSVTMSRKQQRLPVLSVLPFAFFRNGDTGLTQTSKIEWANKYLNAEEVTVVVPIPDTVLQDSEFDLWGQAKPRIVEAVGAVIDGAIFFSTNKPDTWAASIVDGAVGAGNEFVRGSVPDQDLSVDVSDTMSLVEDDGYRVSAFTARSGIESGLRGLRDQNGGLIFQPTLQAETPDSLYGRKLSYCETDYWDDDQADLIAGDFRKGLIGLRHDISWKLFTEASYFDNQGNLVFNLAQQHMVALDLTIRLAWQVPNPVNRKRQIEADRYPFSVLRPAGFTP